MANLQKLSGVVLRAIQSSRLEDVLDFISAGYRPSEKDFEAAVDQLVSNSHLVQACRRPTDMDASVVAKYFPDMIPSEGASRYEAMLGLIAVGFIGWNETATQKIEEVIKVSKDVFVIEALEKVITVSRTIAIRANQMKQAPSALQS